MDPADGRSSPDRSAANGFSPEFLRPPEPRSAVFLLWMALALVAVLFVLYWGADAWLKNREAQRAQPPATAAVPRSSSMQKGSSGPAAPSAPLPAADAHREPAQVVTKCRQHGKTSYSDGPCPAGAAASRVVIERGMNVADGLRTSRSPPAEAAAVGAPAVTTAPIAGANGSHKPECEALGRLIEQLDAYARQPLMAQEQDRIRQERQRARDRQFALRC